MALLAGTTSVIIISFEGRFCITLTHASNVFKPALRHVPVREESPTKLEGLRLSMQRMEIATSPRLPREIANFRTRHLGKFHTDTLQAQAARLLQFVESFPG
jgi:hypothetical protein